MPPERCEILGMVTALALGSIYESGKGNYSNLGTLYHEVVEQLSKRVDWNIKCTKKIHGRFQLCFGEAQGSNINWKILSGYGSLYPGLNPLVNYYRGFQALCRKSMMVKTLKDYLNVQNMAREEKDWVFFHTICPETFIFYPAKREESEIDEFLAACAAHPDWIWILKPSDGTKGHSIEIMTSPQEILQFIDSQSDGSIAWVAQRYLDRPLLIPTGKRKFDIRVWVLLDSAYRIHVYNQGVLRVTAKTYEPDNLTDIHSHLSNHCIAETHTDYGKYEPTNEIWFDEFESILYQMSDGNISFHRDVIPKIHEIIRLTLMSVKEKWECGEGSSYRSFGVFGYDFMLTESMTPPVVIPTNALNEVDVWLIEVNSSPAVAEKLLPIFAQKLIELAIDSIFGNEGNADDPPLHDPPPSTECFITL